MGYHCIVEFFDSPCWYGIFVAIETPANHFLASTAAGYNLGFDSMTRDLNCTRFQATIGLSTYTLGFGIVPIFTAAFSEEFGRQPLYIVSAGGFFVMYIMVAL